MGYYQENYEILNGRITNTNTIDVIENNMNKIEWEIDRLKRVVGLSQWSTGDDAARLDNIEKELARKGTMKRRRVTVRAGNQVVEVVRN